MANRPGDAGKASPTEDLKSKVAKWLAQEGYPTEFQTAAVFRQHHFRVFQGYHVRENESETPREIDVLAMADAPHEEHPRIRCEFVVECKWSRDKPWVVFASRSGKLGPAACIAQTISSSLGSAILWNLAHERNCQSMALFHTPDVPGFGGRQAFSKGNDLFYSSVSSVTSACTHLVSRYDRERRRGVMPEWGVVAFPIVVIDGELFQASFNEDSGEMEINPADSVRCHWRGARSWNLHATIDFVRLAALNGFLDVRSAEVYKLLKLMDETARAIKKCSETGSLESVKAMRASAGLRNLHPLLRELVPALNE
jgi:hypothetical protein